MSVFLDLVLNLTSLTNQMKKGAVLKFTVIWIITSEWLAFNTTDFLYPQNRKLFITMMVHFHCKESLSS